MIQQTPTTAELMPQAQYGNRRLIAHMRKSPTLLYNLFLELVRRIYTDPASLGIQAQNWVWDPDPAKATLRIATELDWTATEAERVPAIYVRLGPLSYQNTTGQFGASSSVLAEGETAYSRTGAGTVVFVHLGGTAAEACALADVTHDILEAFTPIIISDFCFERMELAERTPRVPQPKESKERYASLVTLRFQFQETWTLKQESQRLKAIATEIVDAVQPSV